VRRDPDLGEAVRVARTALAASLALLFMPHSSLAAQQSGRLEGTVTDSIRAAPYAGATVRATRLGAEPEVTLSAVADKKGNYRFDRLDAGTYVVSVASPLLDSLEYGGPPLRVTVASQRTTRANLGTPSRATLQAMACPGAALPEGSGVLLGTVTSTETDRPLPGAQVAIAWSELAIDTTAQQVTSSQRAARVSADDEGQYRACGVPMGEWLVVQVQHAGRAGAVVRTSIGAAGVAVRNLSFSSAGSRPLAGAASDGPDAAALPEGVASLTGSVLRADGQPIAGAQIQVLGTAAATRTDEQGNFALRRLPAGTLELEARQLGYGVARRSVELRGGRTSRVDLRLERAVALDSIRVVARRLKYPDFESRRRFSLWGKFLDEDEIEQRHLTNASDLIFTLPGFWVVGAGAGARVVSTSSASLGGSCEANIVIDRVQGQRINDVPASQIAAVESYPRGGGPPQYQQPCGMIVIWTKQ
jgi:hypothetical protein